MSRVIVGYGECKGFLLTEVSSEFLAALGLQAESKHRKFQHFVKSPKKLSRRASTKSRRASFGAAVIREWSRRSAAGCATTRLRS